MNPDADKLISACNDAASKPAVKMAGIAGALRLLVAWVLSIEMRLEKGNHGIDHP